jgi:hypothetical protein
MGGDMPATKRNPEISTELARISEALEILEKCLGDHHQRISPVLRQEPQTEGTRLGGAVPDEHRSSTIGSALQQIRYKIERVTGALNGMSLQIEL